MSDCFTRIIERPTPARTQLLIAANRAPVPYKYGALCFLAAKKAGVSNYIVKPFNAATLKTKMEAVFGPSE